MPGLTIVAGIVIASFGVHLVLSPVSPLLCAIALGVSLAPVLRRRARFSAGVGFSARTLLRAGVALLGLQVSVGQLAELGPAGVVLAAGTIACTLAVTIWLGRRLRVSSGLTLLIAAGTGICGASAIAAMNATAQARTEDVGYAIGMVTVFGTAAMLLLPVVAPAIGLSGLESGLWAGASIHEVAQATSAGAMISVAALKAATLVKLTRVALLAPTLIAVATLRGAGRVERVGVPGFLLAFLGFVGVRSLVDLPASALDGGATASTALLAAGLAALGLGISPRLMRAAGGRPLALALAGWLAAAASSLMLLLALDQ
jgi:uncharacterized integral membrane protein (TIGR00698 family)